MSSTALKIVTLTTITMCFVLAIWSFNHLFANKLIDHIESDIELWSSAPERIELTRALSYVDVLDQSVTYNPLDATAYLMQGRLYQLLQATAPATKPSYTDLAEQSYQQAIMLQPTWDKAWIHLAHFYHNNHNQKRSLLALTKALTLGPYEYDTQEKALPLIFRYWDDLHKSPGNRLQIANILTHVFRFTQNKDLAFTLALETKQLHILNAIRPYLKYSSRITPFNIAKKQLLKEQTNAVKDRRPHEQ